MCIRLCVFSELTRMSTVSSLVACTLHSCLNATLAVAVQQRVACNLCKREKELKQDSWGEWCISTKRQVLSSGAPSFFSANCFQLMIYGSTSLLCSNNKTCTTHVAYYTQRSGFNLQWIKLRRQDKKNCLFSANISLCPEKWTCLSCLHCRRALFYPYFSWVHGRTQTCYETH